MINILGPGDFFLTKYPLDKEGKFRARIIVNLILIAFLFVFSALIHGLISHTYTPSQVGVGLAAMSLQLGFLLGIKLSGKTEAFGIGYIVVAVAFIVLESVYVSKSLLATGLQTLINAITLGFLITNRTSYRVFLTVYTMSLSILGYWLLKNSGFTLPYGLEPAAFIDQVEIGFARRSGLLLISMILYGKLKFMAIEDIDEEMELRTQEAKIKEVMFLIQSTFPTMRATLQDLRAETRLLRESQEGPNSYKKFEEDLKDMARASRSMTWIYRACRNENVDKTSLENVQLGLEDLLNRKLINSDWTIDYQYERSNHCLKGPIPSLVLLQISLIDQIMQSSTDTEDKALIFETHVEGDDLMFRIKVNTGRKILDQADPLRRELIEDLLRATSAQLSEVEESGKYSVEVRGQWLC